MSPGMSQSQCPVWQGGFHRPLLGYFQRGSDLSVDVISNGGSIRTSDIVSGRLVKFGMDGAMGVAVCLVSSYTSTSDWPLLGSG